MLPARTLRIASRSFSIVIGFCEAMEINRKIHGTKTERPMTHDLMAAVIRQLGAYLERVVITELLVQ